MYNSMLEAAFSAADAVNAALMEVKEHDLSTEVYIPWTAQESPAQAQERLEWALDDFQTLIESLEAYATYDTEGRVSSLRVGKEEYWVQNLSRENRQNGGFSFPASLPKPPPFGTAPRTRAYARVPLLLYHKPHALSRVILPKIKKNFVQFLILLLKSWSKKNFSRFFLLLPKGPCYENAPRFCARERVPSYYTINRAGLSIVFLPKIQKIFRLIFYTVNLHKIQRKFGLIFYMVKLHKNY